MNVDPAREQEMLNAYETKFRPAAIKQPGFINLEILKLRTTLSGKAPAGLNYRFVINFRSEEDRQHWINSDLHKSVWPLIENTLLNKASYTTLLFDTY